MSLKWYKVYADFAEALFKFYQIHGPSSGTELFNISLADTEFVDSNSWLDRFDTASASGQLDPIHVYASFNSSSLSDALRVRRLNCYLKLLAGPQINDEIDFEGCPTPYMIKIMARRPPVVVEQVWDTFGTIIKQKQAGLSQDIFDQLKGWYGISISSFTIFLFWTDAEAFLPLDKNTIDFLFKSKYIESKPKNYRDYAVLLEKEEIKPFYAFSAKSYEVREPELLPSKPILREIKPLRKKRIPPPTNVTAVLTPDDDPGDFRIIGMRVYKETTPDLRTVLPPGHCFVFYKSFGFDQRDLMLSDNNDAAISYNPLEDIPLYYLNPEKKNKKGTRVNISAIVGGNGSGKSTLTELMFMAINNFAKIHQVPGDFEFVDGVVLDLFFVTDSLFKLHLDGKKVILSRYSFADKVFSHPIPQTVERFNFERFFYAIAVNYALYALNDTDKNWLHKLFWKNDQYQIPIVLNPFRDKGNIDINRENKLVLNRLLTNLLIPIPAFKEEDKPNNIRKLTNRQYAQRLVLSLDKSKFKMLYKEWNEKVHNFEEAANYWGIVTREIKEYFALEQFPSATLPVEPTSLVDAAYMYIVKKLIAIAINYRKYNDFFTPETNSFDNVKSFLDALSTDYTHVTHKLHQALNFLKYDHIRKNISEHTGLNPVTIIIQKLADDIEEVRAGANNPDFRVVHFIPPSFFNTDIILTGEVKFDRLSSGEKQRVYSVSSLAYHLMNIDSIGDEDGLIPYRFVNILFDEVELYFHPEMQRSFIKYVLDYLSILEFDTLTGLNISFITHSPFILSDIPASNILFLGGAEPQMKTFGANIHELLSESFFMQDSFMGDFAQNTINDLINFLTRSGSVKRHWTPVLCLQVIESIGEELIRDRLREIYKEEFAASSNIDLRLDALKAQVAQLEHEKNKKH